jgi:hypothetical protein
VSAPDLSRLRGMAALPSTILLRVSQEELRLLLRAVDEREALREAAGALLEALSDRPEPCGRCSRGIATIEYDDWNERDTFYACDSCIREDDLNRADLPPAAPLRALRALLGRTL